MAVGPRSLAVLAGGISIGLLFQILACVLYKNWWPALSAFLYVLLPMPYLFFSASSFGGPEYGYGDEHSARCWQDAGKFLGGLSGIGSLGIPSVLRHAGMISGGALALSLLSAFTLGGTAFAFDYVAAREDEYGYSAF